MITEQRLQRLERQSRLYRHLFILAALGLVAALTYGATKPIPRVIEAGMFAVVGHKNKTVAMLRSGRGDGGALIIYGPKGHVAGKEFISATVLTPFGGSITVYGSEGKSAVSIDGSIDAKTGGYIGVANKTGETVVQLGVDEYGNGVVGAFNRKGVGRTLEPGPE